MQEALKRIDYLEIMSDKPIPQVAVLQFPGSNCESETVRALQYVGLQAEVFRWNRSATEIEPYNAFVIPGGFSYEDRVRAGVIAAKESLMDALAVQAERGKPILGICNGAQILLESGLLPGLHPGKVEMALAHNYTTFGGRVVRRGHHCGWVNLRCETQPNRTPFTRRTQSGDIMPITISHGEGRFTSNDESVLQSLEEKKMILWRFCNDEGKIENGLPTNPNGSYANIAGICNPQGNVAALMPHPERAFFLRMVPSAWFGPWGARRRELSQSSESWNTPGPGYAIFQSLAEHLKAAE